VNRLAIPIILLAVACTPPRVHVVPADQLAAVAARIGAVGEGDALIVAAGDIADCGEQLEAARSTAALVQLFPSATVIAAGDTAYPDGAAADYARCYEPTWGAFKSRTKPAPGNHEHHTPGAAGYHEYFGVPPFYSFEVGSWHVVSIDSMLDMSAQSEQVAWLRRDLESSGKPCVLAFWHHPRFSSGHHGRQRSDPGRQTGALWQVLAEHRAALIVNGHDHHYERFARIDGIREIVTGTGGASLRPVLFPRRGSEVGDARHYGVLVLTLHPTSYEWHFLGIDGAVHDASSAPQPCR
jgi:3',5'-cyclic AMP phosphodiesterase CpdA